MYLKYTFNERVMLTPTHLQLVKDTVPVLRENGTALTNYFYERMLGLNPDLKETFNMGHQRSGEQAKALASAVLAYAENIENLSVLGDAVNQIITKHVSLNIQPEQYSIVGENLLASISEVLEVPMDSELIKAWEIAYTQLANILIEGEKARYEELVSKNNGWSGWREFEVVKKEEESDEVTSFYFKPVDKQAIMPYKPGQYISIRVYVPELGFKQPRQYTLSHYGSEDYYRISVKREDPRASLESGYVSTTLHNEVKVGDVVELSAPNGVFHLQKLDRKNVFISGGVGITPMVAMLGKLSQSNYSLDVSFLHACRSNRVLALRSDIQEFKKALPQLQTYLACEENDTTDIQPDKIGRLELEEVDSELLPKDADYYLCGPDPFLLAQMESLKKYGIDESQIYMERFNTGAV